MLSSWPTIDGTSKVRGSSETIRSRPVKQSEALRRGLRRLALAAPRDEVSIRRYDTASYSGTRSFSGSNRRCVRPRLALARSVRIGHRRGGREHRAARRARCCAYGRTGAFMARCVARGRALSRLSGVVACWLAVLSAVAHCSRPCRLAPVVHWAGQRRHGHGTPEPMHGNSGRATARDHGRPLPVRQASRDLGVEAQAQVTAILRLQRRTGRMWHRCCIDLRSSLLLPGRPGPRRPSLGSR
jgi:hypothetical protein